MRSWWSWNGAPSSQVGLCERRLRSGACSDCHLSILAITVTATRPYCDRLYGSATCIWRLPASNCNICSLGSLFEIHFGISTIFRSNELLLANVFSFAEAKAIGRQLSTTPPHVIHSVPESSKHTRFPHFYPMNTLHVPAVRA
jgi:hypothetical protein